MENQVMDQVLNEQPAPIPMPEQIDEKIGFWEYLGLIILFAIPVVGFIAALILLFAPRRKSLKNFAGAAMTWLIVQVVASVLTVVLAVTAIGGMLIPAINDALGTEFQSFGDAISIVNDFTSGNYSSIIEQMEPQILEAIGEEYAPLLDELATGKYDDLLEDIATQNYTDALEDLKEGDYPQLKEVLSEEEYTYLMGELETAAKGGYSEFFGEIQNVNPETLLTEVMP